MRRCHGEAARSVLTDGWGDVFARFHAVAAKLRSRTRNSVWPFGTNSLCTISLISKEVIVMLLKVFSPSDIFDLGDVGLFHWEDCHFVSGS